MKKIILSNRISFCLPLFRYRQKELKGMKIQVTKDKGKKYTEV